MSRSGGQQMLAPLLEDRVLSRCHWAAPGGMEGRGNERAAPMIRFLRGACYNARWFDTEAAP